MGLCGIAFSFWVALITRFMQAVAGIVILPSPPSTGFTSTFMNSDTVFSLLGSGPFVQLCVR